MQNNAAGRRQRRFRLCILFPPSLVPCLFSLSLAAKTVCWPAKATNKILHCCCRLSSVFGCCWRKVFWPGKLRPNSQTGRSRLVGREECGWNLLTKACEAQNACIQLHAKIVTSFVFLRLLPTYFLSPSLCPPVRLSACLSVCLLVCVCLCASISLAFLCQIESISWTSSCTFAVSCVCKFHQLINCHWRISKCSGSKDVCLLVRVCVRMLSARRLMSFSVDVVFISSSWLLFSFFFLFYFGLVFFRLFLALQLFNDLSNCLFPTWCWLPAITSLSLSFSCVHVCECVGVTWHTERWRK